MMCDLCCKQFRGWCKSFTATETFLSILEAVLLVVVVTFLTFLILHLLVCTERDNILDVTVVTKIDEGNTPTPTSTARVETVPPRVTCTLDQLQKTAAMTHYYEHSLTQANSVFMEYSDQPVDTLLPMYFEYPLTEVFSNDTLSDNSKLDFFNGVEATQEKQFILALVRIRAPQDITFGCILTIITEFWVLTSASCIEAIEEVDSLDSFMMMEGYGELREGRMHMVDDVSIHPWYQGVNRSYDLAALKSEDSLIATGASTVILPTMLDYFVVTLGEKLTILGYGKYRTIDESPAGRRLHKAQVYILAARQCPEPEARQERRGWCAAPRRRRAACRYCGGAPLLTGARLLGLMAQSAHCGRACDPALFVNVALLTDWIDSVVRSP